MGFVRAWRVFPVVGWIEAGWIEAGWIEAGQ